MMTHARNHGVMVPVADRAIPLDNIWVGVSVENRKHGLLRIEHLRRTPAAVRFLSMEPLIEDLGDDWSLDGIDWVIVGGESGHGARPTHPEWVRRIRDKVLAARVTCRECHGAGMVFVTLRSARSGLRLHGFGFKSTGLAKVGGLLASADSMAWSYAARRSAPMPGHTHQSCANCLEYALRWRSSLLTPRQAVLDLAPRLEAA